MFSFVFFSFSVAVVVVAEIQGPASILALHALVCCCCGVLFCAGAARARRSVALICMHAAVGAAPSTTCTPVPLPLYWMPAADDVCFGLASRRQRSFLSLDRGGRSRCCRFACIRSRLLSHPKRPGGFPPNLWIAVPSCTSLTVPSFFIVDSSHLACFHLCRHDLAVFSHGFPEPVVGSFFPTRSVERVWVYFFFRGNFVSCLP